MNTGFPLDPAPRMAAPMALLALTLGWLVAAHPVRAASPAAADEPRVEPFSAHYTADWKTINVGTSDLVLKADATPNDYLYAWTTTARGVFRLVYAHDVIQRSWFSVSQGHVRPVRYRAEDGDSTAAIDFDWSAGRARGESEKKPVDLRLDAGVQDIMSIQIEVMLDLKMGALPTRFRILDKDEIKEFEYTQEGNARLRTALGMLDTVVVSNHRVGGNRVLRMWFAPSLGYVPVLAERSRDGKVEFAIKIKAVDGPARALRARP